MAGVDAAFDRERRDTVAGATSLRDDLRQCTLDALIEAVTAPQMPESFLIPPLVLTHSICASSVDLFTGLVRRFVDPAGSSNVPVDERAEFVIRTRVLVVIRTWVQQAPYDFRSQPALAQVSVAHFSLLLL